MTTHCSMRWVSMVRTSTRGTRNHIDLHDRNESLYNRRDTHGFCLYNNAALYPWQFRWYLPCLIWDLRRGLKRINYTLYSQGPNHLMVYNVFTFKGLGQQTLGAMDRFHATFISMAAQSTWEKIDAVRVGEKCSSPV